MTTTVDNGRFKVTRNRGRFGVFLMQIRTEIAAARRNMEFVVGAVAIPAVLYAMFGLPNSNLFPGGTPFSQIALASFGAYGVISLAIFTFGDELAKERGRGWIRTLRATPIPMTAYMVGKMAMAAVYGLVIVALLAVLAIATGSAQLSLDQWLGLAGLMVVGVLAFSTLGLSLAFLVRPKAATAIANLIFLPIAFFSGFFFPLGELPEILSKPAPFMPSHHFGQLVWRIVAEPADIEALTGTPIQPVAVHILWVAGFAVVGGLVAFAASRRQGLAGR